jgi:uncharacterized membrane protein YidH (DUF202 family)
MVEYCHTLDLRLNSREANKMTLRMKRTTVIALIVSGICLPSITAILLFTGATSLNPAIGLGLLIRTIIGGVAIIATASGLARKWNKERQEQEIREFEEGINRLVTRDKEENIDNTTEVTYEDIERHFSKKDLTRYNTLCKDFVRLAEGKNNIELWNITHTPSELRKILDEIHALREKYDFLKGSVFFKAWRLNPNSNQYEETYW